MNSPAPLMGTITIDPLDVLPSNPPRIAPALCTFEEAGIYLRIDRNGTKDITRSVSRLVKRGKLASVTVSRVKLIPLDELKRFVREVKENRKKKA